MAYRHILTIYDGTEDSRQVLDMVCRIARPNKARVTILIVRVIPLAEELPTYAPGVDADVDLLVKDAEDLSDARGVTAAIGVRYARAVAPAVVAESRLHGVDCVALSIPDLDRMPSEAAWHNEVRTLLRQTTCAVMLCRPGR
ncbi:MAG: universal stress protein [Armatimonadota bacterium]|nr:universal stress protein [Armatimonadota bacterium]